MLEQRNEEVLKVNAFKLPHHGSRYNLSPRLIQLVETQRYLIPTDGTSKSRHPDPVALSRIVTRLREDVFLEFNYDTATTKPWGAGRLTRTYKYDVVFPATKDKWLTVVL